jgi:hypothetical protein
MKSAWRWLLLVLLLVSARAAGAVELYANGIHIVSTPGVVVEHGVSYVPLRAVAEAVGAKVDWRPDQQTAVVCRGNACVLVKANEGLMREDHLLLPIRKLAERLGGTVRWQGGEHPRIDLTMPPREE